MSIVQPRLPGARVLDLFAGSGALGIEALSRGALTAEFVDNNETSIKVLRANLIALGANQRASITRADAVTFARQLAADAYDIAFADPPYVSDAAQLLAEQWLATQFAPILGIEHDAATVMPPGADTRRYGDTSISLYR